MSPRRRSPRAGFVLVEALATLALSALVLAGAASLVGLVLRAADRTAMSVEQLETTHRAVGAVARDIRSAVRVHRQVDNAPSLVFFGSPEQLLLVLDRPGEDGVSEPVVVHWLSETTDAGRGRLIRSEAPLLPGVPTPPLGSGDRVVVDTGPSVIRFAYFAPMPRGSGEVLTDAWSIPQSMPTAVRIGTADPETLSVGSSLRVAFGTDAEIGCGSPGSGYCSLTPDRPAQTGPRQDKGGAVNAEGQQQGGDR
jgi:type II secretory pathway pseudopilin PulG